MVSPPVNHGHMVLIFFGRKDEDVYNGSLSHILGCVAKSLESLVCKGLVNKEKLESFNLPIYGPSDDEVMEIVMESHMFDLVHMKLFEVNWDPYDDSVDDVVHDIASSSQNITMGIRSVLESLIASHFGESILDVLFQEFRPLVAQHLEREKTKYAVIVMSLKKI
uniref:Jasmonate O-methyltransferase n=1 Tax=Oryza meridionalis TaxID=40149 RepID=A0A0E0DZQ7_9ORYZ